MSHHLVRRFEFDAAHRLPDHAGLCRNVHGHRYGIEVEVVGSLAKDGVVVDFATLKGQVGGWLLDNWDHAYLGADDDEVLLFLRDRGYKVFAFSGPPTAEKMAAHLHSVLKHPVAALGARLARVTIHETPTCQATYIP